MIDAIEAAKAFSPETHPLLHRGFVGKCNYRYWRKLGYKPPEAVQKARADLEAGKDRYTSAPPTMRLEGAPLESGYRAEHKPDSRWVENPDSVFQFVGYADQIARDEGFRSIDHFGWYCRANDWLDVMRGAVFRSRKGLHAGYVEQTESKDRHHEKGFMSDSGGAVIDTTKTYSGAMSAAHAADSMAEKAAEESREYDKAYQAGRRAAEKAQEIADARLNALALCAAWRQQRKLGVVDAVAQAVRNTVCDYRFKIALNRKIIANLKEENRYRLDAFNEGFLDG